MQQYHPPAGARYPAVRPREFERGARASRLTGCGARGSVPRILTDTERGATDGVAEHIVEAPAPGKILKVYAAQGQPVAEGDRICLMEALKMELPIVAPASGTVTVLHIAPGQNVEAGDPLAVIEE